METNQIMDEVTMTQTGETQGRETNVENLSSRKHPKRRKRIVFSIILVLVIAIGVSAYFLSDGFSVLPWENFYKRESDTDHKKSVIAPIIDEIKGKTSTEISFNEWVSNGVIDFSVNSASAFDGELHPQDTSKSFYQYLTDVEGETWLVFYCSVKNISHEAIALESFKTQLTIDGYIYEGDLYYDDGSLNEFIYSIKALGTEDVMILFSIPDNLASKDGTLRIDETISNYYWDDIDDMDDIYDLSYTFNV
jgi:hypothetical protein